MFVSHQGRRTSKRIGDKAAAEAVASTIRAKLQLGEFSFEEEKPLPMFKKYVKTFLKGYSKLNHKQSTQDSYNNVIGVHILPVFGDKRLNKITRKDIKDFSIRNNKTVSLPVQLGS